MRLLSLHKISVLTSIIVTLITQCDLDKITSLTNCCFNLREFNFDQFYFSLRSNLDVIGLNHVLIFQPFLRRHVVERSGLN